MDHEGCVEERIASLHCCPELGSGDHVEEVVVSEAEDRRKDADLTGQAAQEGDDGHQGPVGRTESDDVRLLVLLAFGHGEGDALRGDLVVLTVTNTVATCVDGFHRFLAWWFVVELRAWTSQANSLSTKGHLGSY